MKQKITIKTPGKLMVAGEFAVLEPYHTLVVMAVDRFVYTTIEDGDRNELHLNDFGLTHLSWQFDGRKAVFASDDVRIRFVKDAITTALTYLQELNIVTNGFSMAIHSELDDQQSGVKYGLGSSAAVVTSVISAILEKYLPSSPTRMLIFKLAAISHIRTQGNGSGADIAASTYGGVLQYTSFQAEWLILQLENESSIQTLVQKEWPYLSIKRVRFPTNIRTYIGWTGKAASTKNLVNQILQLKKENIAHYRAFLQASEQAVQLIIRGMQENDVSSFLSGIKQNRKALAKLGKRANVELETEKLCKLSEAAENCGGAGKLSGAGGGDCGLAFLPFRINSKELLEIWEKEDIQPLALQVYANEL